MPHPSPRAAGPAPRRPWRRPRVTLLGSVATAAAGSGPFNDFDGGLTSGIP